MVLSYQGQYGQDNKEFGKRQKSIEEGNILLVTGKYNTVYSRIKYYQ